MWPVLFFINPPNLQQWNSNLHIIFKIILTFKTGIFVFGSYSIHKNVESLDLILLQWDFKIFPIYESDVVMAFYNISLGCTSKFLPIHQRVENWYVWVPLVLIFCQIVRAVFQAWYVCRRVNLWLNCPFSREQNVQKWLCKKFVSF